MLPAGAFDLVFTGIGALCWLPDVRPWAATVAALLATRRAAVPPRGPPGAVGARRARTDGLLVLEFPYFETGQPRLQRADGTYVATDAAFVHNTSLL